jgi:hypothetical protein
MRRRRGGRIFTGLEALERLQHGKQMRTLYAFLFVMKTFLQILACERIALALSVRLHCLHVSIFTLPTCCSKT